MMLNPLFMLLITPVISALIVYFVGKITGTDEESGPNRIVWLCFLSILLTFIPLYMTFSRYQREGPVTVTFGAIDLTFDGISMLLTTVLLILSSVVVLFSVQYIAHENHEEKFYAQLLILIASIIGLSTATDLFNLYVWFELMAVSTYTLVSFYRDRAESLEAGIKYLVQSAAGSVFVMLGTAILFGVTGELKISAIREAIQSSSPAVIVAAACLIIGYGVKSAIVPMHFWLPDAHSQAPAGISAMLSGIVIETGLIAMLRGLSAVKGADLPLGTLFLIFGSVNMLLGTFSALRQQEVKRMLAFSSISHMGYILLGVGFALTFRESAQNSLGIFSHIFNHALMKGLAFLSSGALVYCLKISNGNHDPLYMEDLNGVSKRYPIFALSLSIAALALSGLPLFSGFMSKWLILAGGAVSQKPWVLFFLVLAAFNSVLSLGHYAPMINRMYRHTMNTETVFSTPKYINTMYISIIALCLMVILFGFFPSLTQGLTQLASESFYAMFY